MCQTQDTWVWQLTKPKVNIGPAKHVRPKIFGKTIGFYNYVSNPKWSPGLKVL